MLDNAVNVTDGVDIIGVSFAGVGAGINFNGVCADAVNVNICVGNVVNVIIFVIAVVGVSIGADDFDVFVEATDAAGVGTIDFVVSLGLHPVDLSCWANGDKLPPVSSAAVDNL